MEPSKRGKVRDIYDFGDRLLMVATDRISAFDWILPDEIPDKGRVLTQLSLFWLRFLKNLVSNHFITDDITLMELELLFDWEGLDLQGRSMLVHKADVVPIECVVRGYLSGSGWKEYKSGGKVCGIQLPGGLIESSKLSEPIFTPATKEEHGHDENISFERMCRIVGTGTAEELKVMSISLYKEAAAYAAQRGIIIADTKFEWGWFFGKLILIDEVLTPDSSRFWPADQYEPGHGQPSYDKQFVRDYLESSCWDKNSPPPALPQYVIDQTRAKYIEAYERITGETFAWK